MKSSFRSPRSACLKSMLLIVQLALFFGGPTVAQAGQRDSSIESIPPKLNDQAVLPQGYLITYSATDRFDDGGTFYYPHSSYSIYTTDGKFFKNVENHISRSDEIPAVVALPAGSYTVSARAEKQGYVRVPVLIKTGQRTILDLDLRDKESPRRLAHN